MATRLYLSRTSSPIASPVNSGVGWVSTALVDGPNYLAPTSDGSTMANETSNINISAGAERDTLLCRWVSDRLASQDLSSYFKGVCRVHDSSASDTLLDFYTIYNIALISADGTELYENLLPFPMWYDFSNWAQGGTATSRIIENNANYLATTIQAGARLMFEFGANIYNSGGSTHTATPNLRIGSSAANDLSLSNGSSNDYNPWVEFSQTLDWYEENPVGMVV